MTPLIQDLLNLTIDKKNISKSNFANEYFDWKKTTKFGGIVPEQRSQSKYPKTKRSDKIENS